jgi:hypothetical protein
MRVFWCGCFSPARRCACYIEQCLFLAITRLFHAIYFECQLLN